MNYTINTCYNQQSALGRKILGNTCVAAGIAPNYYPTDKSSFRSRSRKSRGNVSLPEHRSRYSNFVARASRYVFGGSPWWRAASRGSSLSKGQEKFWPFARTASLAGQNLRRSRLARVAIARRHREQRILQGYSLLLRPPSRNLVFINTPARGRTFMPGFCASSPSAIFA